MYSATHESVTVAREQRQENTDRVKNRSDCRIRYRDLWKKNSLYNTAFYVIMIYITSPVVFIVTKVSRLTSRVKNDFIENRHGLSSLESFALDFKKKFIFFLSPQIVAGVGSSVYLRLLYNLWCWESITALAFCHRVLERVGLG